MKLRLAMLAGLILLWTGPALAQGCAMCYSTAAATNKESQMAINRAVTIMLAPPVAFMTIGAGLVFRYARRRDNEANRD